MLGLQSCFEADLQGADVYFRCTTGANTEKYDCSPNRFLEQSLEKAILDYLQALSSTMQEVSFETKQQVKSPSVSVPQKIKTTQKATVQKENGVLKIYEAYKANQLSKESYLRQMECVETEMAFLREQLAQYEKDYQIAIQNQKPIISSDYERVKKYAPFTSLSKEIADEFVEAIYIESNGVVTVARKASVAPCQNRESAFDRVQFICVTARVADSFCIIQMLFICCYPVAAQNIGKVRRNCMDTGKNFEKCCISSMRNHFFLLELCCNRKR